MPDNEERNEWLAANTVDFFNEISLLYGLVADDALKFTKPGEGFPPGFEYRWADGVHIVKPMRCSSPECEWLYECIMLNNLIGFGLIWRGEIRK